MELIVGEEKKTTPNQLSEPMAPFIYRCMGNQTRAIITLSDPFSKPSQPQARNLPKELAAPQFFLTTDSLQNTSTSQLPPIPIDSSHRPSLIASPLYLLILHLLSFFSHP